MKANDNIDSVAITFGLLH